MTEQLTTDELAYLRYSLAEANRAANETPQAFAHRQYLAWLQQKYGAEQVMMDGRIEQQDKELVES